MNIIYAGFASGPAAHTDNVSKINVKIIRLYGNGFTAIIIYYYSPFTIFAFLPRQRNINIAMQAITNISHFTIMTG